MIFTFEHVGLDHGPGGRFDVVPLDLRALKTTMARWQTGLDRSGWNALYWDNHDQPRIVSRFGDDEGFRRESATMLATVLHLHRGTPYVYQGEELGMTNARFTSFDEYRDIESLRFLAEARESGQWSDERLLAGLAAGSRDNARTPVQWDASPQAGFTTGTPWLAVNPNHVTVNAERERADEASVFHHYRRLIALRHDDPVVRFGDFALLLPDDPDVYAFTRSLDGETLVVAANFRGESREVDLGIDLAGAERVIGNSPEAESGTQPTVLRPWEALVLRVRG